uniref:TetR family transcriptional regulator C-terminal domain-containing protein n=1 Tax=Clavibacter michiganensis TaxID=28447 RepID=UPI00374E094F
PTAREVATAFLKGALQVSTRPDCPSGCLGVQGSLAAGETGRSARDLLADWREGGVAQLRDRFRQAVDDGDLPPDTDPLHIARYLMTFANGISVQATGGATREDLQRVAETALRTWPPA